MHPATINNHLIVFKRFDLLSLSEEEILRNGMPQQHVIPIWIVSSMISASIRTTKGSIVRPVKDRVEKRSLCSLIMVKKKKTGLTFLLLYQWKKHSKQIPSWDNYVVWDTRSGNSIIPSLSNKSYLFQGFSEDKDVFIAQTKARSRCYHHNCLGLSSNHSTALKILHKGEPSAPSSHILCGRPPAWSEVRLLLILPRTAEGKEVQSSGGEYVGRKHTLEREHSLRPLHTTAETTHACSRAGTTHTLTHTSRPRLRCALWADITGRAWVCRSGLSGPVESVPTVNAQSSVTSELTHLFCWADEVWRGLQGERELALLVCKLQNGGRLVFFFFLHKSTTKWTYTWFRKRKKGKSTSVNYFFLIFHQTKT